MNPNHAFVSFTPINNCGPPLWTQCVVKKLLNSCPLSLCATYISFPKTFLFFLSMPIFPCLVSESQADLAILEYRKVRSATQNLRIVIPREPSSTSFC